MPKKGYKLTDEHKEKIQQSMIGKNVGKPSPLKGKKRSKEICEKISRSKMGHKHSEETKQKMREAKLRNPTKYWLGKHLPQEMKDAISRSNREQARFIGPDNPRWNDGIMNTRGYRYVKMPDHPIATKAGYVLEHRLVMEEHLGRYLKPEEVVHHINEDGTDNRIENLRLFSCNADHLAFHRSQI